MDHEEVMKRVSRLPIPADRVLAQLAEGKSESDVLEACPGLEEEDIRACAAYGAILAAGVGPEQVPGAPEKTPSTSHRVQVGILWGVATMSIYLGNAYSQILPLGMPWIPPHLEEFGFRQDFGGFWPMLAGIFLVGAVTAAT